MSSKPCENDHKGRIGIISILNEAVFAGIRCYYICYNNKKKNTVKNKIKFKLRLKATD